MRTSTMCLMTSAKFAGVKGVAIIHPGEHEHYQAWNSRSIGRDFSQDGCSD